MEMVVLVDRQQREMEGEPQPHSRLTWVLQDLVLGGTRHPLASLKVRNLQVHMQRGLNWIQNGLCSERPRPFHSVLMPESPWSALGLPLTSLPPLLLAPGFSSIFSAPAPSSLAVLPSPPMVPLLPDDRKELIKTNV